MKTSPIRFDDLAFILLFFFMIVAVVSFSNSGTQEKQKISADIQQESPKEEQVPETVFLDKNGKLSKTQFSAGSLVDLECEPETKWQTIQEAIHFISNQNVTVNLIV